jgi:antitoxin component YwqK of YwqJK toxin-antitoxin module
MSSPKHYLVLFFLFCISSKGYMQLKYVEKYPDGQIKIESYIKDNSLDSIYIEYHSNGRIKIEGQFKNCDTKNMSAQGHNKEGQTPLYYKDELKISPGKRHGLWIEYYENAVIRSKIYYNVGLRHGNSLFYDRNGKLKSSHYHIADKEISMHKFRSDGGLELSKAYFYNFNKGPNRKLKMTLLWEFHTDGALKIQRETQLSEDNVQRESLKEYYADGILKTETEFLNGNRDGIHREYHKNSNPKYEGTFKEGKAVNKHHHYNLKGQKTSTEYWYNGKLLGVEKH